MNKQSNEINDQINIRCLSKAKTQMVNKSMKTITTLTIINCN